MTEVKDERKLVFKDETFDIKDFSEEGQNLYNKIAVLENLLKKNNVALGEISVLVETLIKQRNDMLKDLAELEPVLREANNGDKSKNSETKKED